MRSQESRRKPETTFQPDCLSFASTRVIRGPIFDLHGTAIVTRTLFQKLRLPGGLLLDSWSPHFPRLYWHAAVSSSHSTNWLCRSAPTNSLVRRAMSGCWLARGPATFR